MWLNIWCAFVPCGGFQGDLLEHLVCICSLWGLPGDLFKRFVLLRCLRNQCTLVDCFVRECAVPSEGQRHVVELCFGCSVSILGGQGDVVDHRVSGCISGI